MPAHPIDHTVRPGWRAAFHVILGCTLLLGVGCAGEPSSQANALDAGTDLGDLGAVDGAVVDQADGADVATRAACSSDGDCPSTGDACTLRRCLQGACVSIDLEGLPCDDGATCTVGDRCTSGACAPGPDLCGCQADADCDGDKCQPERCDKAGFPWRCVADGAPKVCADDGQPCTAVACDPSNGSCVHSPAYEGLGCDDGDPCTAADHCQAGTCSGASTEACVCKTTADCAAFEDGDLCNGTLYCDTSGPIPACTVNPASVVVCAATDDTACSHNLCAPKTGVCAMTPVAEGEDCTAPGACKAAACKAGSCTPTGKDLCACETDADCAKSEDGDLCNGTLYCDLASGQCEVNPATIVQCPTGADTACRKSVCLPSSGACYEKAVETLQQVCDAKDPQQCAWKLLPPGSPSKTVACDDEDACTAGDTCAAGVCTAGKTNTCKCGKDADCATLEDGNPCNGTLFCNPQVGQCQLNPATTVFCPSVDDSDCVQNACDPKSAKGSCKPTPVEQVETICITLSDGQAQCRREIQAAADPNKKNIPCDDGDACTAGTTCEAGTCTGGANTCKCATDADCKGQDDGNQCNGLPYCDKASGLCQANSATTVVCKTAGNTDCTKLACHPASGQCIPTAVAQAKEVCNQAGTECRWEVKAPGEPMPLVGCDDGNACTASDTCYGGLCQGGASICECQQDADCEGKDDGDKCNGTWYCDKSAGKQPKCTFNPASVVNCGQQPPGSCAKKACDPKTGSCALQAANEGKPCDDGDPCTAPDVCAAGSCGGQANLCDDGDLCTTDACVAGKGCTHGKANCQDGNACTLDLCDGKTGQCAFDAKAQDDKLCDADGDPCTPTDRCQAGACKAGAPVVCKLPTGPCEKATCVAASGGSGFQCVVVAEGDGAPCADGAGCTVGATCKSGACSAGAKPRLLHLDRQVAGWSGALQGVAALEQGDVLAVGRLWQGESSKPSASAWWIERFDRAGSALYAAAGKAVTPTSAQPDPQVGAWAVGLRDDGDAWVVGAVRAAEVGLNARALRVATADGKTIGSTDVGAKGSDEAAFALAVLPGGAAILAGSRDSGTGPTPWIARLTAAGGFVWQATPFSGSGRVVDAAAVAETGAALLIADGTGASAVGQLRSVLADGKAGPLSATLQRTGGWSPRALAPAAGGWWVAGATTVTAGATTTSRPHWARLDTAGSVLWQRVGEVEGDAAAIAVDAAGAVLAGSRNDSGGNDDAWWARIDGSGNRQWQRTADGGAADGLAGLVLADDGDWVAVGLREIAGKRHGLLARTDAFGHASCAAAGGCVGKSAADCGDDKACTADDCHPSKGCQHTAVDDFVCDPKDGCSIDGQCKGGSCNPGEVGKLFAKAIAHAPGWHFAGVAPLAGGGFAVAAHQDDFEGQQPRTAWLVRFDEAGSKVDEFEIFANTTSGNGTKGVRVTALAGRADGGFAVGVSQVLGDGPLSQPRLVGVDAKGAVQWTHVPGFKLCANGIVQRLGSYPNGDLYDVRLCPNETGSRTRSYALRRKGTSGVAVWVETQARVDLVGGDLDLLDGVVVGTETLWLVGGIHGGLDATKAKRNGAAVALDGQGNRLWERIYAERAATQLHAIGATSDGALVAVGWRDDAGTRRPWLLGLGAEGKVMWQRAVMQGPSTEPVALVSLADGALLLAGTQRKGLLDAAWVGRFDALGELVRESTFEVGLVASVAPHSAIALSDGTALFVGDASVGGLAHGMVARADRWGHVGCKASAGCLLQTPTSCDDGKACTTDACATGACTHATAACSDGDPCTTDSCDAATGCAHGSSACDDGKPCTADVCDPLEGCVHLAIPGCTANDPCQVPSCAPASCDGEVIGGRCLAAAFLGYGNRDKAVAGCAATGRVLASLHDAAETHEGARITQAANGDQITSYWTGGFKPDLGTAWAWADGSTVDYSGTSGYKPLSPSDAQYFAMSIHVQVSTDAFTSYWQVGNAKSNLSAMPLCVGMPKASCTTKAAPDGTPCGSGASCAAGVCKTTP
ncbi:MAG: C-type lectin domain-containing protein [Deltaproteobacteria bacterium]|nr:C-type lectin domain-containing protein [Deltaproteobacteria bacterium]